MTWPIWVPESGFWLSSLCQGWPLWARVGNSGITSCAVWGTVLQEKWEFLTSSPEGRFQYNQAMGLLKPLGGEWGIVNMNTALVLLVAWVGGIFLLISPWYPTCCVYLWIFIFLPVLGNAWNKHITINQSPNLTPKCHNMYSTAPGLTSSHLVNQNLWKRLYSFYLSPKVSIVYQKMETVFLLGEKKFLLWV